MTANQREVFDKAVLVLVMGLPGSGKTTLAKQILRRIVAVYMANNFLSDAITTTTRMEPNYLKMRPALYRMLYRITEENLMIGNTVLLDVPHVMQMANAEWRNMLQAMCNRCHATLAIIRCTCSLNVLQQRLMRRGEARDHWKLDNWERFLEREPPDVEIPFRYLDVDTTNPIEETADGVIEFIREAVRAASA